MVYPGLKLSDFVRPTAQVIYHEDMDFHYTKAKTDYPTIQPTLNAVYADLHARPWKVMNEQTYPNGLYDPNWFYIVDGTVDITGGNLGTVEDAWDDAYENTSVLRPPSYCVSITAGSPLPPPPCNFLRRWHLTVKP